MTEREEREDYSTEQHIPRIREERGIEFYAMRNNEVKAVMSSCRDVVDRDRREEEITTVARQCIILVTNTSIVPSHARHVVYLCMLD